MLPQARPSLTELCEGCQASGVQQLSRADAYGKLIHYEAESSSAGEYRR